MLYGDMNNYDKKQLEFDTEQLLKYVTMSTINVYNKLQSSISLSTSENSSEDSSSNVTMGSSSWIMEYYVNRIGFVKTQKTKYVMQTTKHIFQICID